MFSGFLVGSNFQIAPMLASIWSSNNADTTTAAAVASSSQLEVASDSTSNNGLGSAAAIASAVALNLGAIYGILSSITTALHAIVIKKALDVVKGNTMELVYYNNVLSFVGCLPVMWMSGEMNRFADLIAQAWVGSAAASTIALEGIVSVNDPVAYTKLEAFAFGVMVTVI